LLAGDDYGEAGRHCLAAAERLATEGELTMKKLMIAVLAVTGVALANRGPCEACLRQFALSH